MEKPNIFDKIFVTRAVSYTVNEIESFIEPDDKILDIGSGTGITAEQISKKLKVEVEMVDVVNKSKVNLPLKIYDGKKLPYDNRTFDVSLLIYVLHHTEDARLVLNEAKRVTKKYIIVYEDIITRNPFDKISTFFHGLVFEKTWNLRNRASFKSEKEWAKLFEELGLKIIKVYPLPIMARLFYPVYRMQFVLHV